jgi:predicted DNA binding CopG/RHH family protein
LGLQSISIRLQKELIEDLKLLAKEMGIGYQPYIRQLLTQHVREKKKNIRVVR